MSHDAFLASIRAAPDDDLPRLVFADWLDEHGDPARAEFIRVQCELTGLSEIDPRRPELEDREHALLAAGEATWCGFPAGAVSEWEFRRGFVDQVAVPVRGLADPPTVAALARHPVRRLALGAPEDDGGFAAVSAAGPVLGGVEDLDLSGWFGPADRMPLFAPGVLPRLRSLAMAGVDTFSRLTDFLRVAATTPSLTALDFSENGNNEGPPAMADFLAALGSARLETLGLAHCGLMYDGLVALLASSKLSSLLDLDIGRNPLGWEVWRAFRDADPVLRLARLNVSGVELLDADLGLLLNTPALGQLTDLELNDCWPGRDGVEALAASPFWGRAKSLRLRLRSDALLSDCFGPLCRADGPPALRLLDLGDNVLMDDDVRLLCGAPWAGSLTWLGLTHNGLSPEGRAALARSGRFPHLRTLHLGGCCYRGDGVTVAGALELARAPGLARLRFLTLDGTDITDAAVGPLINGDHWNLSGLGLSDCDLSAAAVRALAASPKLARLEYLDLSRNPWLGDRVLDVLADSPYLSPMCELNVRGVGINDRTRAALRDRLGVRLSE